MKITVDTLDLKLAIDTVSKAMPTKCPVAVLEGIYMEAIGDKVLLKCTDMSLQIETVIPADVEQEGAIVMPGRLTSEIVRKMPSERVEISASGLTATITSGKAKFKVQSMDAAEYSGMARVDTSEEIEIEAAELHRMIKGSIIAAAQDETKPILKGVLTKVGDGQVTMAALDGYRLAKMQGKAESGEERKAIIPAKSLLEISRITGDGKDVVNMAITDTHFAVRTSDARITTRLLEGEFVDYVRILPTDHALRIHANREELLDSVERAALIGRESKGNIVILEISGNEIMVSANSEVGSAHEEVEAQIIGDGIKIAFNAKYLADALRVIDDEYVAMELNTNVAPCVIRPTQGEAYYYLVLPVRVAA